MTTMTRCRPLHRTALALFLLPVIALGVACGGGGGSSSPTDPGTGPSSGTASIAGQVSVGGGSGNLSSGLGATAAADQTGAGVTVRIQGTVLSTRADASGAFHLTGVPRGNQVVVFETSASSAGVQIDGIEPQESIRLDVVVEGSTARVENLDRDAGDGAGSEEGPDDPDEPEDGPDQPDTPDLSLQISPDTWNTNFANSSGTVTTFIRGEGFGEVILDSIVMVGDDALADPLHPLSSTREGDHVRNRWAMSEVLGILDEPEPGSIHEVCLELEADGFEGLQVLCGDVEVVGPGEDDEEGEEDEGDEELGDLTLEIAPQKWNLAFDRASGHVTVFIRGDGLHHIDADSFELEGDHPTAAPLPATFARLEGEHVRAQFARSEVLDLLDEPERNSTHQVTVRFTSDGGAETHELTTEVEIVGGGGP